MVGPDLDAEGIEIGMEMAADAVGADHHQRADGIARRLMDFGLGGRRALGFRLLLQLVAELFFDRSPVAVKGVNEIAVRRNRPVLAFPRSAARFL